MSRRLRELRNAILREGASSRVLSALNEALREADLEDDGANPVFTGEEGVVVLDERRLRRERQFEGEAVAYLEAVWGAEAFAFDVAIRDLEAMRRGEDDGSLRPPETDYEAELLVRHLRDLANDLARMTGQYHLVRVEDDLRLEKQLRPVNPGQLPPKGS